MDGEEVQALVIDNGGDMVQAGFAGEDAPRAVFPPLVGFPRLSCMVGMGQKNSYVGDEAWSKRGILRMKSCFERDGTPDWYDVEKIWHHAFYNELRVAPEEHPVLMSEHANASPEARKQTTQIMFETFNSPAFLLTMQNVLSVYDYGRLTALAVTAGHQAIDIVPVYEGHSIPWAGQQLRIGGANLTASLIETLIRRGYSIISSSERATIKYVKENYCRIPLDFEAEMKAFSESSLDRTYEMPDGTMLNVGSEQISCPEALFRPTMLGLDSPGIDSLIASVLRRLKPLSEGGLRRMNNAEDSLLRRLPVELVDRLETMASPIRGMNTVVTSGGCSMIPGFPERLQKELTAILPKSPTKVLAAPERKYAVWIGGSILASLSTFQDMWISKLEYDEDGPVISTWHCF